MSNRLENSNQKRELRDALGRFPTGVAIATTLSDSNKPVGMTINSLTSISLDPALIAWSIDHRSGSHNIFTKAREFAVTVLGETQTSLAMRFATPRSDRFKGLEHAPGGVPIIPDACAWFKCETWRTILLGDHTMLVGKVIEFGTNAMPPLVFSEGKFQRVGQNPDATTRAAA